MNEFKHDVLWTENPGIQVAVTDTGGTFLLSFVEGQKTIEPTYEIAKFRLRRLFEEEFDSLQSQVSSLREVVGKLAEALGSVDKWFETMATDQHSKLVEGQTFESACENWFNLLQEPLNMVPIKEALSLAQKVLDETGKAEGK